MFIRFVQAVYIMTCLAGCILVPCGNYEISGTTADNAEGEMYNGHWHEDCGWAGTSGNWNLFGDGHATISFLPDAAGDRSWQSIDLVIGVSFPTELLVEDTVIDASQMYGGAYINPGLTLVEDEAALVGGTIEVASGEAGDVCVDDGPTFRLRWDLTYGEEGGPMYVLDGSDRVQFSSFLSEDCGGF